jgi:hypothetical protein
MALLRQNAADLGPVALVRQNAVGPGPVGFDPPSRACSRAATFDDGRPWTLNGTLGMTARTLPRQRGKIVLLYRHNPISARPLKEHFLQALVIRKAADWDNIAAVRLRDRTRRT